MSSPAIWAILVAGGSGTRYNTQRSKLLELLDGKPVIWHSFLALKSVTSISGFVIVTHPDWEARYRECLQPVLSHQPTKWVQGGVTRRQSVWNGLQALPPEVDVVLIHDAARPLVKPHYIQAVLDPVVTDNAYGASLGVPITHTLKEVLPGPTAWVKTTLNRERIWQVHTPQVFQRPILVQAHQEIAPDISINDDAELVERQFEGQPVVVMVADDPLNLKITTPADLQLAEAVLACAKTASQSTTL